MIVSVKLCIEYQYFQEEKKKRKKEQRKKEGRE